jgi:hypothetical protein
MCEYPVAVAGHDHHILDPDATVTRNIHPGLNGHHVARLENVLRDT